MLAAVNGQIARFAGKRRRRQRGLIRTLIKPRCASAEGLPFSIDGWAAGRASKRRTSEGRQRSLRARSTTSSVWCAPAPPSGANRGRCSSDSTTQSSLSSAATIEGHT